MKPPQFNNLSKMKQRLDQLAAEQSARDSNKPLTAQQLAIREALVGKIEADVAAAVAANNAQIASIDAELAAIMNEVEERLKNNTPEENEAFFKDLAAQGIVETGKDYINDPVALQSLRHNILIGRGKSATQSATPSATPKPSDAMTNFFTEWCVQCPILEHLVTPDSDLEDTAGALCPDEVLDTCPILLQLRDVRSLRRQNPEQDTEKEE